MTIRVPEIIDLISVDSPSHSQSSTHFQQLKHFVNIVFTVAGQTDLT